MKQVMLLLYLLSFFCIEARAQANIPLDSWRTHFSYHGVFKLAEAGDRIYAAGTYGLFYFDRSESSTVQLSALQGLSDAGIRTMAYQAGNGGTASLLIAYHHADIDLLQGGEIYNIRALRDAALPGDRQVYNILFQESLAYLATDYGISVLDLQSRQLRESYFNLGPAGEPSAIYQLAVWKDSLFAATSQGLMANALRGANLADFNSWKHFSAEGPLREASVRTLEATQAGLFAGSNGEGLYQYEAGEWLLTSFTTDQSFRDLQHAEGAELLISLEEAVHLFNPLAGSSRQVSHPLMEDPYQALTDADGNYWIADGVNGLLSNFESDFRAYIPAGPLADLPVALHAANEELIAVYGRHLEENVAPGPAPGEAVSGFSLFRNGSWHNFRPGISSGMPPVADFTDVAWNSLNQKYYFSSSAGGLIEWDPAAGVPAAGRPAAEAFRHFISGREGVSLEADSDGKTPVRAVSVDEAGQVWMLQPIVEAPLHRYNPTDNSWHSFLHDEALAATAQQLMLLPNDDKWLRLAGAGGILVFNEEEQSSRRLTHTVNEGGLYNPEVKSMALDLEGQVWVGLQQGVNYFANPFIVLQNTPVNAAFPVYERGRLLNGEEVTALAVDGGNRKWIGTPNGLWVFGDYGDTLHHHFTTANSPLPDNHILDIAIEQKGGEVFISTRKGIVSYRAAATEAGFQHASAIKVFPNPVYPGYEGKVGISGLVRDAIIKITDVSGRLVKELAAEGGTASWDVTDMRGRRPATGVYLIFSASADGSETLVGKVALVN
jgi:hypothetical protein